MHSVGTPHKSSSIHIIHKEIFSFLAKRQPNSVRLRLGRSSAYMDCELHSGKVHRWCTLFKYVLSWIQNINGRWWQFHSHSDKYSAKRKSFRFWFWIESFIKGLLFFFFCKCRWSILNHSECSECNTRKW